MPTETQEERQETEEKDQEKQPADPRKKRLQLVIAGLALVIVLVGVVLYWLHSENYENTDDAQIDGHLNPISSNVAGTIKGVYVENNQFVEAGKPLVDLDTRDYEATQAQLQAQYDQGLAELRGEQPNLPMAVVSNRTDAATSHAEVDNSTAALSSAEHAYASSLAQLAQTEANNDKAQSDVRRYKELLDKQEVAHSEYDQYDATAKAQAAAVAAQKETVESNAKTVDQRRAQANEQNLKLRQTLLNAPRQIEIKNANIQAKSANLESIKAQMLQNQLNLSYCHLVAPVSGLISQRSAELGARISVGQQLMVLVQTSNLWVTANFKETQLRTIRVGQAVAIKVDALDKTFNGKVESLPSATGDRTSALPPENATGNYVKIVQRLPLRIRFNPNQDGLKDLRPGMSVEPKITVK